MAPTALLYTGSDNHNKNLERDDGSSVLSACLHLESPRKQTLGCAHEVVNRKTWLRRTHPECQQQQPMAGTLRKGESKLSSGILLNLLPNC